MTALPDTVKKHLFAVFLVSAIATIIYSNSFDCSFHFDDQTSIVENHAIHQFDLKGMLRSARPVLDFTLALNYYFGKLNVFGYHLVNLLLHIANSIMIYFILIWTTNFPSVKEKYGDRAYRIALYAALIFVAHPIQTQAVTYIISRSSVLATTFYLLSLLLFIKVFREESQSSKHKAQSSKLKTRPSRASGSNDNSQLATRNQKLYLLGAFLASCLGMGTKQIAATIPAMILIYDFCFISDSTWKTLKKHYKVHLAMFSTLIVAVYLNASLLDRFVSFDYGEGSVHMPHTEPITSFQYFLTQLHVIPYYIKLLFIPTNLNLDYDWPITRTIDLPTIGFFLLLVAIVAFAIAAFRWSRILSFGIIWFFVTLSVTSSFVVIYDMIFEHRLYLPSVGFAIFGALAISRISTLNQYIKNKASSRLRG